MAPARSTGPIQPGGHQGQLTLALVWCLTALSPWAAFASTDAARAVAPSTSVFRCEPAPGSASVAVYTDQPCPRGQSIEAQDARTSQQRMAAAARAREEGRWAESMARQRQRDERAMASQQQRQPSVIGREKVDISRSARSDALRDAELRRMARPHRQSAPPPTYEPPAASGGNAPKATPGRP